MYKAGIVGLGKIASGYGTPEDRAPYTHAGGILHSDKVTLAAAADVAATAVEAFTEKWGSHFPGTRFYQSFDEMQAAEQLDIVAVCVRGPHHFETMKRVIAGRPKAIFLEKPPSCSLAQMDEMVAAAKFAGIPITVSYSRHWGPHVLEMARLIRDGLIGEITHVVGHCGGGLLSFASHTTDMICQFAGYDPVAVFARGRVPDADVPEGYGAEPAIESMVIEFGSGVVGTQIGCRAEHGAFYCDVAGTEGRAMVPFYGVPQAVDKDGKRIELDLPETRSPFAVAYDQIADYLSGGPLPDCTDDAFVAVNEIGFGAIESIHTDRRIELPNTERGRLIYANG